MNEEEEVKEEISEDAALADLDDAFETDDAFSEDELGLIADVNEEEEDFDTDYMLEDRDGNY